MKVKELLERPTVSVFKCNKCGTTKDFVCNKKTYNFLHNKDQSDKNAISNYKCKNCGAIGDGKLTPNSAYVGEERYGEQK